MKYSHEKVEGFYGYRGMKINMKHKFKQDLNYKEVYRLMKIDDFNIPPVGIYTEDR